MMTQTSLSLVTRELVPDNQRMTVVDKLFGMRYVLELEPAIFSITERMTESYSGGFWNFFLLSNGGFYLALAGEDTYHVTCDNYFEGDLSADALGITATLWAYSHLSFTAGSFAHCYADHYHRLREYMFEHQEVREILGATD